MEIEMSDTLNRRAILAGAAAVPALAVPASAGSPPLADSRLLELERQVAIAEAAAIEAGNLHTEAEEAMIAWERSNPEPVMRSTEPPELDAELMRALAPYGGDWLVRAVRAILHGFDKNGAAEAALAEHSAAIKLWEERRRIARTNCHYDDLEADYHRLLERADAIRAEAAEIVARTIEDLRCKVRMMSQCDLLGLDNPLVESIVDDLGAASAALY
jgi:hypothetical protein